MLGTTKALGSEVLPPGDGDVGGGTDAGGAHAAGGAWEGVRFDLGGDFPFGIARYCKGEGGRLALGDRNPLDNLQQPMQRCLGKVE